MVIWKGECILQKTKKSSSFLGYLKMLLCTTLAGIVVTVLLLLFIAFLLQKIGLNEKQVQMLVYMVYMLVSFTAGVIAGKWQGEKKFMWGTLAGGCCFVLLLLLSLCLEGFATDTGAILPALICMLGGGMLGGMVA